jgi:hypothetical protein
MVPRRIKYRKAVQSGWRIRLMSCSHFSGFRRKRHLDYVAVLLLAEPPSFLAA